jgi:hypothetical protein
MATTLKVGLYTATGTFVAYVDVTTPLPPVITYGGNTYAWSPFYYSRYVQVTPYAASADSGSGWGSSGAYPPASVLAFPQY